MTTKDSIEKEKPESLSQMETVLEMHKEGVPRFPTRTSLSELDPNGKVQFYRGSLKATYDFVRKGRLCHE